jgi:hypothetical protein
LYASFNTDGCDYIFKTKENIVIELKGGLTSGSLNGHFCHITLCNKTLVPPMNGLFVWYWKCLLAFITSIMHKLNRAAIFLEHLSYFGIKCGCGTKTDVSSFRDVFEIVCVVDLTPH